MTPHKGPKAAPHVLRVADLPGKKATRFSILPKASELKAIAAELGLLGLKKLRFEGEISPQGESDWQLSAHLGATVEQPCTVTLEPVKTRIEEKVTRYYSAALAVPEDEEEVEMPEDESIEVLTAEIDLGAVMVEALSLALPLYPRADAAELENAVFTEPGKTPMTDQETRPFAGLAGLRDQLKKTGQ